MAHDDPFGEFPLLPAEPPEDLTPQQPIKNPRREPQRPAQQPVDITREALFERPLPSSPESERAILGAIILDNALIGQAIEVLRPEDFYVPSHRRIYVAMIALFENRAAPELPIEINPILLAEELRRDDALESVGGMSFLTNLTYGLPHVTSISHYARIVRGKSILRQLIKSANKSTSEALEEEDDPEIIVDHAIKAVLALADDHYRDSMVMASTVVEDLMVLARENAGHGVLVTGIRTGLTDLDQKLGGLQKTHLVIVAARPSMGKSSLALCIAENLTVGTDQVVVIFSLEMSNEELALRLLCSRARVDSMRFRDGILSNEEWDHLGHAAEELSTARIIIDDSFDNSVIRIRAKCQRVLSRYGRIDLVIVDYLQLMDGRDARNQTRERDVADNSRGLKGVAKDMKVPLIALSQLSRKPEDRPNKRPQLADLRESGAIEQDADEVIFIYREAYYQRMANQPINDEHFAELIVAKARTGKTGVAGVRFEERITRFENLARQ